MLMGESAPALPSAPPSPPAGPAPAPLANGRPQPSANGPSHAPSPEPAPAGEPKNPANLVPPPSLRVRVAWYAGAAIVTALILAAGLRLDQVSLRAPFSYDVDTLLIMPMVKATLERGFGGHWRNERLGYPGIQELYDFPVIDHLHFAAIWLLGRVISDWVVVYNLYFLLTWPLTTLTAMYAFRRLGLTLPMAAAGGILYAFQPYHYLRSESHYFLAAYWMVPLSWLPALAVCRGELPFFRRDPAGTYRLAIGRWQTFWQVLLAAATASAGAYYAFFACAVYCTAGVYGWVAHRTWKAAAAAGALVVLVGGFGVANHLPTFGYVAANGRNSVAERYPEEAEIYALKIAHLVLPIDGHNLTAFGRVKSRYTPPFPLNNENTCASLGLIGAVGLVGLLAVLVLPVRRGWPQGPLAALAAAILLFALMGGFGVVFNLLIFEQVRCYNRFSIYLAFLCLFAVLWPLDWFLITRTGWARRLRYPAVAALTALGIADQTPTAWFDQPIVDEVDRAAARFEADRRFFTRIEEVMPPGAKIFNIPYIPYPEVPQLHLMGTYEHARGYLHTATLVWSYGAIKNREADAWNESAAHDGRHQLLRRVAARGFDGIFIDKRGMADPKRDAGDALIAEIRQAAEGSGRVKLPVIFHEDGRQAFLDIRPYRDWLRDQDPVQFETWAREEREWAAVTWLHGFYSPEPYGLRTTFRWGYKAGTAVIVNPADRTRRFLFAGTFGADTKGEYRISIDGGDIIQLNREGGPGPWADEIVFERKDGDLNRPRGEVGVAKAYLLEVPPGRHTVRFRCQPPPKFMPGSPPYCYYIMNFQFGEVK